MSLKEVLFRIPSRERRRSWYRQRQRENIFRINIPDGVKTALSVRLNLEHGTEDFCGTFSVSVGQGAELNLIWMWDGKEAGGRLSLPPVMKYRMEGS